MMTRLFALSRRFPFNGVVARKSYLLYGYLSDYVYGCIVFANESSLAVVILDSSGHQASILAKLNHPLMLFKHIMSYSSCASSIPGVFDE